MKRIAAPMVGGIVTSFLLELLVYPAIYAFWRQGSIEGESEEASEEGKSLSTTRYLELGSPRVRV
jgi:Cu(I)/Ag(I) efflux system membrane protein CusA/SilA